MGVILEELLKAQRLENTFGNSFLSISNLSASIAWDLSYNYSKYTTVCKVNNSRETEFIWTLLSFLWWQQSIKNMKNTFLFSFTFQVSFLVYDHVLQIWCIWTTCAVGSDLWRKLLEIKCKVLCVNSAYAPGLKIVYCITECSK